MAHYSTRKKSKEAKPVEKAGRQSPLLMFKKEWWILIILLITFISFFPSLKNGFVNWDDFNYVRDNSLIKDISFQNIRHILNPATYVMGNYHPLTVLTCCIEYNLIKLNPFYYHLDNILLHLMNVVLVFVFIRMLLLFPSVAHFSKDKSNAAFSVAAITALLFAVHPLRVESVTWVAERKDVLYTFFFLGSLICYLHYIKTSKNKFYFFSIILFLFSILSKGQAVVLAPLLLLLDYFLKRDFNQKVIAEKILFFILALIFGVIAMKAQTTSLTDERLAAHNLAERMMIAGYGFIMYLYKFILPIKLACFYRYPEKITGFFFIAPFVVLGLLFLLFRVGKKHKALLFGGLFFIVTIIIVLQFLPVGDAIIAERYTYIPFIGLFFSLSYYYVRLLENKPKLKVTLQAGGAVVIALFVFITFNQTKVWKDSKTLWTDVIEKFPTTAIAYGDRGQVLIEEKNYEAALEDYNKAIFYDKSSYNLYKGRAIAYRELGKYELAIADYKKSLSIYPAYSTALFGLGGAYIDAGKPDSGLIYCNMALKYEPKNPDIYFNRAAACKLLGRLPEAIECYNTVIELNPAYAEAYNGRGAVYQQLKKYDTASEDYKRALSLKPGQVTYMINLAGNYTDAGKNDSAIVYFDMAINNKPDSMELYTKKASFLKGIGKLEDAMACYNAAIEKNPRRSDAYSNRGNIYYIQKKFDLAIADYNESIKLDSSSGLYFSNRAMAYYDKNDFAAALHDARLAQSKGYEVNAAFLAALKQRTNSAGIK